MKTNITLDESQREEMQASANHLGKLLKKFAAVDKQHAEYTAIKTKATARLAAQEAIALEKAGEEAGEKASEKALAIRHQLGQLDLTLRRLEREYADLESEAADAAFHARTRIRAAHRPLVQSIITEATEAIAPYYDVKVHARQAAESLPAVSHIQFFTRPNMAPEHFKTSGSIEGDLEAIGATVKALLAGEAVVSAGAGDGESLVFPAYC